MYTMLLYEMHRGAGRREAVRTLHVIVCDVCVDEPSMLANIVILKSYLSDIIEPDYGLLDQLLSLEVLSRRQYDDIHSERGATYRRSEALLDLLETEEQCNKFLEALRLCNQQHVVNLIKQNGGHFLSDRQ